VASVVHLFHSKNVRSIDISSVLPIHAAFHRPKPLLWKLFGFFR
jgi:hypothetical protein